jgi:hypothetical protein
MNRSEVVIETQIEETRSAGVTAAATLGILCCISAFLVWGWFFLLLLSVPVDGTGKHVYETHTLLFFTIAIIPPLLVALGIRTSIGLFHLKSWALKGASLWAVLAFVSSSLLIAFQPYETFVIREEFVSSVSSVKQLLAISFVVFTFPLGVWWLFYFTRPYVIRQFEHRSAQSANLSSN